MDSFSVTERNRIHRVPSRGSYDRGTLHAILDEGLVASVGFALEGQPYVIPMVYARRGDLLYLHGAAASRLLKQSEVPLCVTVTLIDGLVLARSAFHHSMNYRSAVILGLAREVTDAGERSAAFAAVVDHVLPGRAQACRPPNDKELRATRVLALPIDEASAKTRTGGPLDDDEDLPLPFWAGQLPLTLAAGAPVPDARAEPRAPLPDGLAAYRRVAFARPVR
jgi:nitroimidazol reductase NimA-like FMN-containing flavoprotein (pyridoxamine 5'-phosphate oxidase superfamily)